MLTVAAPGVLGNDSDPDGDPLTAVLVTGPSHGSLTLNANGSFSYTPAADFTGADSFSYRASDGTLTSNVATVTLNVTAVNDAPVAAGDAYSTAEDTVLTVAAPGVLGNDGDPDGDPLTAVLVTGPSHGSLTLNANGSFSYTPAADYAGSRLVQLPGQRRHADLERGHRDASPSPRSTTPRSRPGMPTARPRTRC